jgi:quercetin dioxygenase-like cupin family protein
MVGEYQDSRTGNLELGWRLTIMAAEVTAMVRNSAGLAILMSALACVNAFAQQAPARGDATTPAAPAGQAPAGAGRGGGNQGVGSQGDPDPGVHFVVVVDNPSVRVLQVTLQPGGARRVHVHNDVTFHMLVPVTGSLEVTVGSTTAPSGQEVITAVPGQAYYMVKGQPHSFTNKTAAAVQVIEVFVKPGEPPAPWPIPFTPPPAAPRAQ